MRPIIRQTNAEKIFRYFFEETWKKYPVIILGCRKKKINLFDDENYTWNAPLNQFKTFNWNADPSAFRIGGSDIAILRTGVHFYKISYHHIGDNSKRYVALRPNTPNAQLPVWRTDKNGKLYTSIGTAINQHAGGDITTGSRGCQTAPRSQYAEFIQFIGSAYGVKIPLGVQRKAEKRFMDGIGNIPYILVTQEQFSYIVNLPENEFDSAEDLKYQAANFVGVPKIEKVIPVLSKPNAAAAAVIANLETQEQKEILATKEIFPENISERIDEITNSATVPATNPTTNDSQLSATPTADVIQSVESPKLNEPATNEQPPIQNADVIFNNQVDADSNDKNQTDEPFYQYLPRITKEKMLFIFGTVSAAAANAFGWYQNLSPVAQIILGIIFILIVGGFVWLLVTHRKQLGAMIRDAMNLKADKSKNSPILTTEKTDDTAQNLFNL